MSSGPNEPPSPSDGVGDLPPSEGVFDAPRSFRSQNRVTKGWRTAAIVIGLLSVILMTAWVVVTLSPSTRDGLFGKPIPVVHIHTVVGPTQYVTEPALLKWQVGACVQDAANNTERLVSCNSQFNWVLEAETTDKSTCLYYSTNGGLTSQSEYLANPVGNDYFCMVP